MAPTADELAGVVDLFGGLTRAELHEALVELAFRRDEDVGADAVAGRVEAAIEAFALVPVGEDPELLAAGPGAFPTLPDGAEDLPHILDVPRRSLDRDAVAEAAERRFRAAAATAVAEGDGGTLDRLLDASYDVEAWGTVDLADVRRRIDDARESRVA